MRREGVDVLRGTSSKYFSPIFSVLGELEAGLCCQ
jgi:hypothetical protein